MKTTEMRTTIRRRRPKPSPSKVIIGSRTLTGLQPGAAKVMTALTGGSCSWDDLRQQTKLTDDQLGLTLIELFNRRLVATRPDKKGERIYLPLNK